MGASGSNHIQRQATALATPSPRNTTKSSPGNKACANAFQTQVHWSEAVRLTMGAISHS